MSQRKPGQAPVSSIAPGGYALVVSNAAAFVSRYGGGLPVAGVYTGLLSNDGETIATTGGPIYFNATKLEGAGDATVRIESNTITILNGGVGLDFGDRNVTVEIAGPDFTGVMPNLATGVSKSTSNR